MTDVRDEELSKGIEALGQRAMTIHMLIKALENLLKIADNWPMSAAYRKQITDEAKAAIAKAKGT
jgi:hypothetical protein